MTRPARGALPGLLTISLVAAGTTCAALVSWRGFVEAPLPYLMPLFVLGALVGVTGAIARWWRLPGYLVLALQVVISAIALSLITVGTPIPFGSGWAALLNEYAAAAEAARTFASPVPSSAPGAGVYPLLIGGGLVCILLVDLCACTLRRVPLAGLPLLTVYSLPVSMLGNGLSWWIFGATAAGFLALLYLHESEQITRWGRPLGTGLRPEDNPSGIGPAGFSVRTGAVRGSAGVIGGAATALAIVLPIAIPTLTLSAFDFGAGNGGGDDSITVSNPIADLRRDLRRDVDIPLLRVSTDDPRPEYLRISVLNRFRDAEWSSGDRQVPTENLPNGSMPALEGVSPDIGRTSYDYDVSVTNEFEATWLPTQAPVSAVTAPGDWRFDPRTMDFIASDDDLDTAGISYSMTAVELQLRGNALADAQPSTVGVSDEYTELPSGLPALVRDLALEQTAAAENRFDKAVALQNWFRREFTYSLEQAATANGIDALEQFLSPGGRVGYCEQFAASMAVMARTLGIPARVAVGFLRPEQVGPTLWEYSAFDLHAWPELYFDGFGWVRFEPTPSERASGVPRYTRNREAAAPPPVEPTDQASPRPRPRDNVPSPTAVPEPEADAEDTLTDGVDVPWLRIGGGLGGLLVLVLVAIGPRLVRDRQRDQRLTRGVEGAWLELRATARDLGIPWTEGRSPRESHAEIIRHFGSPVDDLTPDRPARGPRQAPEAVAALDLVVYEVEVHRYARADEGHQRAFTAEVATCTEALRNGATPQMRRRARWWPASVLKPSPDAESLAESSSSRAEASTAGACEHLS